MTILAVVAPLLFGALVAGLWLGARAYTRRQKRLDAQAIEIRRDTTPRTPTLDEKWEQHWADSDADFWARHGAFAGRDFAREDRAEMVAVSNWHMDRKREWLKALDNAFERIARATTDPQARRVPRAFWLRWLPPRLLHFTSFTDLYAWHMLDRARAMGGWETEIWSETAEEELAALLAVGAAAELAGANA